MNETFLGLAALGLLGVPTAGAVLLWLLPGRGSIARSLGPAGRLLVVQSCGNDPALELVRKVWTNENPFKVNRHELVRVLKKELGHDARNFNFVTGSDSKAIFRYEMHTRRVITS